MNKLSTVLASIFLLLLSSCSESAPADAGKLRIKADMDGAYIYVNDKKKAMANSTSYTNILLAEGEYKVKVEKTSKDGEWLYTQTKNIFVGSDTSQKVSFELEKQATEKQKQRLYKEHAKRYIIHNNGTVTDTQTGLMWMRCSMGQTWDGTTCTGEAREYDWNTAKGLTTNFAGYNDWRLPTIKELNTLIYCSNGKPIKFRKDGYNFVNGCKSGKRGKFRQPTINQLAFPSMPKEWVWSTSVNVNNENKAWMLTFNTGADYHGYHHDHHVVQLVRSGD